MQLLGWIVASLALEIKTGSTPATAGRQCDQSLNAGQRKLAGLDCRVGGKKGLMVL
jgi:hypothetical protein